MLSGYLSILSGTRQEWVQVSGLPGLSMMCKCVCVLVAMCLQEMTRVSGQRPSLFVFRASALSGRLNSIIACARNARSLQSLAYAMGRTCL